jgi:hypothetical protein
MMLRLMDDGKSSMFYWWPLVKDLGIPVPKTIMIRWKSNSSGDSDAINFVDGKASKKAEKVITR